MNAFYASMNEWETSASHEGCSSKDQTVKPGVRSPKDDIEHFLSLISFKNSSWIQLGHTKDWRGIGSWPWRGHRQSTVADVGVLGRLTSSSGACGLWVWSEAQVNLSGTECPYNMKLNKAGGLRAPSAFALPCWVPSTCHSAWYGSRYAVFPVWMNEWTNEWERRRQAELFWVTGETRSVFWEVDFWYTGQDTVRKLDVCGSPDLKSMAQHRLQYGAKARGTVYVRTENLLHICGPAHEDPKSPGQEDLGVERKGGGECQTDTHWPCWISSGDGVSKACIGGPSSSTGAQLRTQTPTDGDGNCRSRCSCKGLSTEDRHRGQQVKDML